MKKALLLAGLLAATLVAGASPASATKPDPEHKVTICHALPASASHPYNRITVDIASSGYVKGGHHRPGGDIGDKHARGGDIIPPYQYGDFSYPGQNWTAKGQAIWENGCKIPPPPKRERSWSVTSGVCSDPFVYFQVSNTGDVPIVVTFRWVNYWTGRVQSKDRRLEPGELWVNRRGLPYIIRKVPVGTVAWVNARGLDRVVERVDRNRYPACPGVLAGL